MIQTLAEFSKRNASHVKGILNLTIPIWESPVWILGQFLWQLGLSTESRRLLEDGQRVRYYRLNTEDVEFAQKVLDYRQRQREEKEGKRIRSKNETRLMRLECKLSMVLSRGAEGKISTSISSAPLHPCPHAFFIAVHTPH
ncbi:hypothetical protein LC608_31955 [Nostoc sp. XA010]|uniref:hypothetical protein n=1 Tax=Nostoc sp. XA010 TaxID=2780407 RepID=UPI001E2E0080|nr:hypothetical protein [Nostoc sp. XA010]MCC5661484.1 hypothetical protein [Nostoc sp. XA010]